MSSLMIAGMIFIAWLETAEPASEICTSPYINALPEQCDAKFNREES